MVGSALDQVLAYRLQAEAMPSVPTLGPKGDPGWPSMFFPPLAGWNETRSPSGAQSREQPVDSGREGSWIPEFLLRREPPFQEPHLKYKQMRNKLLLC